MTHAHFCCGGFGRSQLSECRNTLRPAVPLVRRADYVSSCGFSLMPVRAGFSSAGGGLGPSSLGVTKWETVKAQRLKMQDTHTYHERKKYEGFGGRPPVGGRPGARASCPPPPKSGPDACGVSSCGVWAGFLVVHPRVSE